MNVNGIGALGSPQASPAQPQSGGGTEQQIRQLEQKLEQLGKEKSKAEKAHNKEKAEKIQKQIEELQKQIQLLKQRQKPAEKMDEPEETQTPKKFERWAWKVVLYGVPIKWDYNRIFDSVPLYGCNLFVGISCPTTAKVYTDFRGPFLEQIPGAFTKTLLICEEDV